ncbi:hypothetical protein [Streptomyces sp. NPDC048269]|uniref:hypothetical protein n=1 Tax=Streptomyces sp. NPDC048269 TaxID=3155753 RepID=UPI003444C10D
MAGGAVGDPAQPISSRAAAAVQTARISHMAQLTWQSTVSLALPPGRPNPVLRR